MVDPATTTATPQVKNRVLGNLRSTFTQSNTPPAPTGTTPTVSKPVVNSSSPIASQPSVSDQLDTLDSILTDIEQRRVQAVPPDQVPDLMLTSQPAPEATSQPQQTQEVSVTGSVPDQVPTSFQQPTPSDNAQANAQPNDPSLANPLQQDMTQAAAPQSTAENQQQQPFPTPPAVAEAKRQQLGFVAQAAPAAVDQATNALYQQQANLYGSNTSKETAVASGIDTAAVEAGAAIQYVETEKNPEIPPEVAEYLKHAEDHANQEVQEIVVADEQQTPMASHYPKQSVIVLPITPETEKKARFKGPRQSVRWLVEWSRKLMKMFSGKIIYRQPE